MDTRNNIGRRNFLKSAIIGASGTVAGVSSLASPAKINYTENAKIITRKLGNTGIELPIVSMGVMRADNPNLVRASIKAGINHFDTAYVYGRGNNELMLGEVLKEYPRDSVIIGTKIRPDHYDRSTGTYGPELTKESIFEKFETSLERLQTDYVDILYLHGVKTKKAILNETIVDAFSEIKKQGKAKHLGISTHSNEPEVIQAVIDGSIYNIVLTAINFKQDHINEIKEKIALASKKGIGIIGMKTMAGAFIDREKTKPINCKAALKWVLQDTNVHTTIPGITNIEQLTENISVMENLKLTEEEKKHLEEARLSAGLYCDGCRECVPGCKKKLPVNDIMRAYMYTYGYIQIDKAHSLLTDTGIPENPCEGCTDCTVTCRKGFDIQGKIADVARLKTVPKDFIS
ncbi:MAG: aldo/keto reductase [Bacteroidales bacterium]|nr:MAG: aldo/keto reductase [Bacteroidales bacterium]